MAKIIKLSPHVADLIAAGEVVERPGSVVKELIENGMDAGASSVTVEIKNGGLTYIRVTDNGSGMAAEDAGNAFLRHATSKLREARDLEAIGTLGFRGEALAAISAVSRINLLTREKGEQAGISLALEGGTLTENAPAGCPEGTTIIVRDLFFNTPARLKFMKTDKAEGAFVTATLLKCALSHPEVSMRYIKDGKVEFHTPGDGNSESCIYTLLGRDFAKGLIQVSSEDENVSVTGFVTTPAEGRGNRSGQYFFVNGRCIKSKLLQAAVEQAYKNSMLQGRFPSCVLYLEVKPSTVDVNIHPAKTEVKFLKERDVFSGVHYAVLSALEKSTEIPEIVLPGDRLIVRQGTQEKAPPKQEPLAPAAHTGAAFVEQRQPLPLKDGTAVKYRTDRDYAVDYPKQAAPKVIPKAIYEAVPAMESPEKPAPAFRVIGEALGTYIIVEREDSLILIDKHAAHERIIFDALVSQDYEIMPQILLSPMVFDLGAEYAELLLENAELLTELGFEIDRFGVSAVAVRQVPGNIETTGMDTFLSEICEKLSTGNKAASTDIRDEVLHTVACKAAIKAGKMSHPKEIELLAEQVLSGKIKYCPHGRPVSMELGRKAIDKNFKRIL